MRVRCHMLCRGSLIIRQLSTLLNGEAIFRALARILSQMTAGSAAAGSAPGAGGSTGSSGAAASGEGSVDVLTPVLVTLICSWRACLVCCAHFS